MSHSCALLCLVTQSWPTLCNPMDCTPPGSSVHGDSPGKIMENTPFSIGESVIMESVTMPSSRGSSQPRSPALRADSLSSESPGKPKNTGVSSLFLLQGIFLTQGSNWGLLHCRWILYQLSYKEVHHIASKWEIYHLSPGLLMVLNQYVPLPLVAVNRNIWHHHDPPLNIQPWTTLSLSFLCGKGKTQNQIWNLKGGRLDPQHFLSIVKVKMLVAQSHLTLFNPMDCSPPSSSFHGFSRQEYWSG